jgi:hypothetical protein
VSARAALAASVCLLAACAAERGDADRSPRAVPLLREARHAFAVDAPTIDLRELLGAWTDCGGPDVVVASPRARALVDSARIELDGAGPLAADALGPFVERALIEHGLVLRAAPGLPATLVSVEAWPERTGDGGLAPLLLAPADLDRAAAHAALVVRLAVPVDAGDPATIRDTHLLDGRERARAAFAPHCVVIEAPGREAADLGRQFTALTRGMR